MKQKSCQSQMTDTVTLALGVACAGRGMQAHDIHGIHNSAALALIKAL